MKKKCSLLYPDRGIYPDRNLSPAWSKTIAISLWHHSYIKFVPSPKHQSRSYSKTVNRALRHLIIVGIETAMHKCRPINTHRCVFNMKQITRLDYPTSGLDDQRLDPVHAFVYQSRPIITQRFKDPDDKIMLHHHQLLTNYTYSSTFHFLQSKMVTYLSGEM